MPVASIGSQSSDYFEAEDPDFISALHDAVLPGDIPGSSNVNQAAVGAERSLKRARSESVVQDSQPTSSHYVTQDPKPENGNPEDQDLDTYGASRFGEFGEYMRRKRAKLQIQNAQETKSNIFEGVAIYVRLA